MFRIISSDNADMIFLILMYEVSLETKIAIGKLAKLIVSDDLKKMANYILGGTLSDNDIRSLTDKYPQFSSWLREDDLYAIIPNLETILDRNNAIIDKILSLGGEASARGLVWLFKKVSRGEMDIGTAIDIITSKPRPFFGYEEFHKVRTVEEFRELLKRIGVRLKD